jgi:hypothetical protein
MSEDGEDHIVCATYTHARRHPLVLGHIAGWTPPFQLTVPQLVVLGVTFWIEMQTWDLWGRFLPDLAGVVVAVGLPVALAWVVRRARFEGRSLARAAVGVVQWASTPRLGRAGGRPVLRPRGRSLAGAVTYVAPGEDR